MSKPEDFQYVLRSEMNRAIDTVYADSELAGRVEGIARRRRAARWGGICAAVLVTAGVAAGVLGSHALSRTSASVSLGNDGAMHLPKCASLLSSYQLSNPGKAVSGIDASAGPAVSGHPVAAVVCRYAGTGERQPVGDLAGAAKIVDKAQVSALQTAFNAGQINPGGVIYCPQSNGDAAIAVFAYAGKGADLVIYYDRGCGIVKTAEASYVVRDSLSQIIIGLTGAWLPVQASPAG